MDGYYNEKESRINVRNVVLKNGMELVIREPEAYEARQILEFKRSNLIESEFFTLEDENQNLSINGETNYIRNVCEKDNSTMLLAFIDDNLAGILCFDGGELEFNRHVGEFKMSISRKYWDIGIGSALLYHMVEWAKYNGITKKINLKVREDDKEAINLYRKCGFIKEGVISKDTYKEGSYFDTVQMGLIID